jgi:hypothetical protein
MADEVRVEGSEDVGYLLQFSSEGVFLTVYPLTNVDKEVITKILGEYQVQGFDEGNIKRIISEAMGEPEKIADNYVDPGKPEDYIEEIPEEYVKIIVDVSKDRMEATVRYDSTYGSKLPTVEMVKEALAEKKVVFGINEEAIENGVRSMNYFVAAVGIPPKHGENAVIERKFDLSDVGKPKIGAHDRADYKDMNLFHLVKRNDLLAVRIPHTEGVPGKDVYGNNVAAKNGRPVPMPVGKNTKVVEENKLIAAIDGQIVDKKTTIAVDPHLVLKSGVNVGTGSIDFTGSVEIKGSIEQGFVVKATGDIEISGTVNGSIVEGRNIFIKGGVNGMNRARIKAQEDIRMTFTESADIEAGRDVYIADVALHTDIRAGKKIILEGKKGNLVGGKAEAGEEVRAVSIGNSAHVITRIAVGIDPNLQGRYKETVARYKEGKKRLQQVTQMLATLSKMDISKLSEDRLEQINHLTRSQFPLAGQIRRDETSIKKLEQELADMKHGKIRVSGSIFPGVRVAINNIQKQFLSEAKHCQLTVEDEVVVITPF